MLDQAQSGRCTVAVLGASNLARGLPWIVSEVRRRTETPVDLVIAGGHGRSYGVGTRFLGRVIPPLDSSAVWRSLTSLVEHSEQPPLCVLTDVGNDLVYGLGVDRILSCVERCLIRVPSRCRSLLVLPPLSTVRGTPRWAFEMLRRVFFPWRRVTFARLQSDLEELVSRLEKLALKHGVTTLTPSPEWYGLDPIHVRRSARVEAWRTIFDVAGFRVGSGAEGELDSEFRLGGWRSLRLRLARPLSWALAGVDLGRAQPCCTLDGRLTLWKL